MTLHPVSERTWEGLHADEKLALKRAAARLADELTGHYGPEIIERFLAGSFDQLVVRVSDHPVPGRLRRFSRASGGRWGTCRRRDLKPPPAPRGAGHRA